MVALCPPRIDQRQMNSLLSGYRSQIALYRRVLDVAKKQKSAIRSGASHGVLRVFSIRKERMLQSIDRIDAQLAGSKRWLAQFRAYPNGNGTRQIDRLLDTVLRLIREIRRVEAESHNLIRHAARTRRSPALV